MQASHGSSIGWAASIEQHALVQLRALHLVAHAGLTRGVRAATAASCDVSIGSMDMGDLSNVTDGSTAIEEV